jgi:hypothetical protein
MNINYLFMLIVLLSLDLASSNVQAQIRSGTYSILTLGTAGDHSQDPGKKGTMTVSSRGEISGSVYSYDDRTTSRFTGSVNLATGRGTLTEGGRTFDISAQASTRTWVNMTYSKRGTTSKGLVWCIR